MSNFVECDRDQAFLLPPDLRDWLPADDLGHFVIEAVERVDLGAFKVNHRGTGSAQYHPRMMLALLIYCYANGIFSSRRIERARHRDIGVRFVAANRHPDHDTIARFRRENFAAVSESFLQVLLLAKELKLLRVGLVSVDGSKFKANANKHRSVTYERAGALIAQLEGEITALLSRAEAADAAGEDDPQVLPKEIARREALRDKLDAACRRLEAQAVARAAAEREAFEAKVAAREKRRGRAKGKHPKLPTGTPAADAQSNLSDPDSRLMRKSKHHEYRQAYNAQAAVDAGGSQLIVSARISQCASDRNDLVADIEAIPALLGAMAESGRGGKKSIPHESRLGYNCACLLYATDGPGNCLIAGPISGTNVGACWSNPGPGFFGTICLSNFRLTIFAVTLMNAWADHRRIYTLSSGSCFCSSCTI